jgi:hypothetical protein
MRTAGKFPKVQVGYVVFATILLTGVLILVYGNFYHSRVFLICGLVIISAGVLDAVLRLSRH